MKDSPKIRIMLVEDHKVVRKGLKALLDLEADMEVVAEASNGMEALEILEKIKPRIMVIDLAMPKLNGIECALRARKLIPGIKILILSAHADDSFIERTMQLSVNGYLVKQCSPVFLIDAIRTINSGKSFYSPDVAERKKVLLNHTMSFGKNQQEYWSPLSTREMQVLQMIAEGSANKNIAADLGISIKTVEKHRQNLMRKLEIHDTAGLTRYAIAEGIIEISRQHTLLK